MPDRDSPLIGSGCGGGGADSVNNSYNLPSCYIQIFNKVGGEPRRRDGESFVCRRQPSQIVFQMNLSFKKTQEKIHLFINPSLYKLFFMSMTKRRESAADSRRHRVKIQDMGHI